MKKVKKISIIIIILSILIIMNTVNSSIASTIDPEYYQPVIMDGGGEAVDIGNKIIGAIQLGGSILSVIVLVVIGIEYLLGSVEEQAKYKEKMQPYIIGAILLFSITNLLGIINSIMSNL